MSELQVWPSPFVFWTEVEKHEEIKNTYLSKIKNESIEEKYHVTPGKINRVEGEAPSVWRCEVTTSYFHRKELKDFFSEEIIEYIVKKPLSKFYEHERCPVPIKAKKHILKEIWFNTYKPGYFQEMHDHNGTTFSGIYLLELNEPNTTKFTCYNRSSHHYDQSVTSYYTTEHIKEGNVILFPSEFAHSVDVCSTEKASISFNVLCEW
jgi:hypothetical protein